MTLPPDAVAQLFDAIFAQDPGNMPPRYNVCPTQTINVVLSEGGDRKIMPMRWGFIPHWYKKPNDGPLLINARAETVAEKPAFRKACRERRCIIPATGFYEWTKAPDGGKDPYYIYPAEGDAFSFAGIWRDWTQEDGSSISTVAIVTCEANEDISPIHHRMPVILAPDNFALWLGEEGKGAATLMQPAPNNSILSYRVSRAINGRHEDSEELLAPLAQ